MSMHSIVSRSPAKESATVLQDFLDLQLSWKILRRAFPLIMPQEAWSISGYPGMVETHPQLHDTPPHLTIEGRPLSPPSNTWSHPGQNPGPAPQPGGSPAGFISYSLLRQTISNQHYVGQNSNFLILDYLLLKVYDKDFLY